MLYFDICIYCEMITTVKLINIFVTSQLPFVCVCVCVCVVRILEIYSLSKLEYIIHYYSVIF